MDDTDDSTTARLRGHHLLCLRMYRGEGYPESFGANLFEVLDRLEGSTVLVVDGPDDVCATCPDLVGSRCIHDVGPSSEIARLDRLASELLGLSPSDTASYDEVLTRLPGVWAEWSEDACSECEYASACAERP